MKFASAKHKFNVITPLSQRTFAALPPTLASQKKNANVAPMMNVIRESTAVVKKDQDIAKKKNATLESIAQARVIV